MGKAECELWLPAAVRRKMVAHAEAAYPEEACGLLGMADSAAGASRQDRWEKNPQNPQISQIAGRMKTAHRPAVPGHAKSRPGFTLAEDANGANGFRRPIYAPPAGSGATCWRVDGYVPMKNISPAGQRRRRYRLDPRALLRMERLNRRKRRTLIGIFHSHPDHPAAPSRWDRQDAWPGYYYVILTVRKAVAGAMTAWQFDERRRRFRKQSLMSAAGTLQRRVFDSPRRVFDSPEASLRPADNENDS